MLRAPPNRAQLYPHYEFETDPVTPLREFITALMNGNAVERFRTTSSKALVPNGYKVDYPSGSQEEGAENPNTAQARLPRWNHP